MIKRNQKIINSMNMITDMMLNFVSYYIILYIRFVMMDATVSLLLWDYPYIVFPILYSVLSVCLYYTFKMYSSFRIKRVGKENVTILCVNGVLIIAIMAVLFIMRIEDFSRSVLVLYWLLSSVAIITKRFFVRNILRYFRKRVMFARGERRKHRVKNRQKQQG